MLKLNFRTSTGNSIEQYDINITELNLSIRNITHIPPEIGAFVNLTHINLYNNKLAKAGLPPEIGQLTKLQCLYLIICSQHFRPKSASVLI